MHRMHQTIGLFFTVSLFTIAFSEIALGQTEPTAAQVKLVNDSGADRVAANNVLNGIRAQRDTIRRNAEIISSQTDLNSVSEEPVYSLNALKKTVILVADGPTFKDIEPLKAKVAEAIKPVDANLAKLNNETTKPNKILIEISACETLKRAASDLTKDLDAVKDQLTNALKSIYTGLQERLAPAFDQGLKPLVDLKPGDDAEKIRFAMLPALTRYPTIGRLWTGVEAAWKDLEPPLSRTGYADHATQKPLVETKIQRVRDNFNGVYPNFAAWLKTLADVTEKQGAATVDRIRTIATAPTRPGDETLDLVEKSRNWSTAVDQILAAWKDTAAYLLQIGRKTDVDNAAQPFQSLSLQSRRLASETSTLSELLTGDLSRFQGDQVRLFYFDDIPRLMYILNDRTKEVGGLAGAREQAVAERRKLTESELDVTEAAQRVNDSQSRVKAIQEELRQAKAQADNASRSQLRAQRRLEDVQKKKDATDEEKQRAERARDDAQRDADASNQRYDGLKDEQNGLPSKLADARRALEVAQADVIRSRRAATLNAQSEVEAFAKARDNAPLWLSPSMSTSSDPAKRVLMYAFNDSKTIFLRGTRDDLNKVKEIITQFDQPEPSARLTLWNLQLNSDGSAAGLNRFNDSLKAIEDELTFTRSQTAAAISLLRDSVALKVAEVGKSNVTGFPAESLSHQGTLSRLYFYEQEVLDSLGVNLTQCKKPGKEGIDARDKALVSLPDPASVTTLGEALVVLALAKRDYRKCIIAEFRSNLALRIQYRMGETKPTGGEWFPSLDRLLGTDLVRQNGITASQKELVYALLRERVERDIRKLSTELSIYNGARPGPSKENTENRISSLMNRLRPSTKIDSPTLLELNKQNASIGVMDVMRAQYPTSSYYARVAAADQMLKETIIAVEDDVDRHFFQPMIQRLRKRLAATHMGLGIIQRTSVLARNRLIARVDASASAQVGLGEEHDILQATQQLAQLVTTAQTGGLAGALGGMQALPRSKGPELYGIGSRGSFQVTPVIDPSGQALRFRFDHVFLSDVREPNGTTNPQLPRVERHTVNTEVQISNLELREVSRFEANTKLGLPTRKSGGIPILNEIPILRDIPLIGWFTKSGGRAGAIQESLIFAQTTIYPTIREMLDLLISQAN